MIKFRQHYVQDTVTGHKAKVWYSTSPRADGTTCVSVYAKNYGAELSPMFAGVRNDTDSQTDYFDKDKVHFAVGSEHYAAALAAAESLQTARQNRRDKKRARAIAKTVAAAQPIASGLYH
jgi:hypothetical protein